MNYTPPGDDTGVGDDRWERTIVPPGPKAHGLMLAPPPRSRDLRHASLVCRGGWPGDGSSAGVRSLVFARPRGAGVPPRLTRGMFRRIESGSAAREFQTNV